MILKKNYKGLLKSLMNSKQLPKLKSILSNEMKVENFKSEWLEELHDVKRIPKNLPYLEMAFKKINLMMQIKQNIENLRNTKYDSQNKKMEEKLMEVWSLLRPEKKIEARISKEWSNKIKISIFFSKICFGFYYIRIFFLKNFFLLIWYAALKFNLDFIFIFFNFLKLILVFRAPILQQISEEQVI